MRADIKILIGGHDSVPWEIIHWISSELTDDILVCSQRDRLLSSLLKNTWNLVILYLKGQEGKHYNGLVRQVFEISPNVPIVVIVEENGILKETEPLGKAVMDLIQLPIDQSILIGKLRRALKDQTRGSDPLPERALWKSSVPEEVLFGNSSSMRSIRETIKKIGNTDLPVLITGENGTGKEMIAKYLWQTSPRKNCSFVKINCAAIPSELLESELFGYEKGAFTGAYSRKPGKFEAADGGFLFLDEVSELPYPLQSKLLHVLQDGKFSALGSTTESLTDVRIMAATNRQLEQDVHSGTFRKDLYFRLNVVNLHLPPLRDRKDQIHSLLDYFRYKFADQYQVPVVDLDEHATSQLFYYSWPGNIRELENVIRRATVLGDQNVILKELQSGSILNGVQTPDNDSDQIRDSEMGSNREHPVDQGMSLKQIAKQAALKAEREAIEKALKLTRWNRKKAASVLDVSYKTLLSKIKEMGIDNA